MAEQALAPDEKPAFRGFVPPPYSLPTPPYGSTNSDRRYTLSDTAMGLSVPPGHCENCGTELVGAYCHACGQQHREGRLTVRRFVSDMGGRLFDLESGLLHTAWQLTVAPGRVTRDYVRGCRRQYVGPATYLIIVATLSILAFTFVEETYVQFLRHTWTESLAELPEENALADFDTDAFAQTLTHWLNQGTLYLSLFMAGVFALLVRWFVPGWQRIYNVAETSVFAVYTTAHGFLLCLPLYGVVLVIDDPTLSMSILSALTVFLLTGYVAAAACQFLNSRWTTLGMTWIAAIVSYLLFSVLGGVVGVLIAVLTTT